MYKSFYELLFVIACMLEKKIIRLSDLSNEEFINKYAAPGLVGLVGGAAPIDRAIRKAQGTMFRKKERTLWSHAFLFTGKRVDGYHWVLESDLEIHRNQIKLGVQENRAKKYFDEKQYPNIAILDFGLTEVDSQSVLSEGLELVAGLTRYSLRELLGTFVAGPKPALRSKENLLAQKGAFYCSAMVQHCYAKANIRFSSGVSIKNITPEDIAETEVPNTCFLMVR